MQTERSIFIYSSIEYLAWFLFFMLIESYANTRVGEVIIGAAGSLLSMGYLGGRIMYRMAVPYSEIKYPGNAISVQIMILVSCLLSMILMVLLAVNDILVVKGASRYIDESLVVSELSEDIDLEEDMWSTFVQKYGFTDRECDVLEKCIKISKYAVWRHDDLSFR